MSDIQVVIDNRVRLVTAVLAASDWPNEEQTVVTHAVHPHAKQTRQFVESYAEHEAVIGVNQALLNGVTLEELFSTALRCRWPDFEPIEPFPQLLKIDRWAKSLADFAAETGIVETFWPEHDGIWQEAASALTDIYTGKPILDYLTQLTGRSFDNDVQVMPNLVYPALQPALAFNADTQILILPPPKAYGESPPWPFDEDPGWVVAITSNQLVTRLVADQLAPLAIEDRNLFRLAATTLCLEHCMDEEQAMAYLVRKKKEEKQPNLPLMVEKLREYGSTSEKPDFGFLFVD